MKQSQIESELDKGKHSRETFRERYTKVKITNVDITELQIVPGRDHSNVIFVINNIFVLFGGMVFQQTIGIPKLSSRAFQE
jgi:hypothetical protein